MSRTFRVPGFERSLRQLHPNKAGKRADLGGQYFRSAMEANYARHLNFLKKIGAVTEWLYEPIEFRFNEEAAIAANAWWKARGKRKALKGVERGAASFYRPDFRVYWKNGPPEWHEIKGWNSPTSKAKLKRMDAYFPWERVVLLDKKAFGPIKQEYCRLIPEWE